VAAAIGPHAERLPEIDRAEWMSLDTARSKLVTGQVPALDAPAGILDAA